MSHMLLVIRVLVQISIGFFSPILLWGFCWNWHAAWVWKLWLLFLHYLFFIKIG